MYSTVVTLITVDVMQKLQIAYTLVVRMYVQYRVQYVYCDCTVYVLECVRFFFEAEASTPVCKVRCKENCVCAVFFAQIPYRCYVKCIQKIVLCDF